MLGKRIHTDEEFMAAWNKLGSPALVAKELGISLKNTYSRRRECEAKHNITLPTFADQSDRATKRHIDSLTKSVGKCSFNISDGTVIVFSDAHFRPGVRSTAFDALLTFIRLLKPAAIIANGDIFDGATISRHPSIGWESKPSVMDELEACHEAMDEIEEAAGSAKLIWPLGNHDMRFETYLAAKAPEYRGVPGFHLKDFFPKWMPCWRCDINDDITVKHRYKGGIHATHNNTLWAGRTMVTGHLHSLKVTPFNDYNGCRWGVDTGTLADPSGEHDMDYTELSPLNHRSGFVVLTFREGELLIPEIVQKWSEDAVCFRGALVDAKTGETL